MNSGPNPAPAPESKTEDISRVKCSHQSTRVLLVLLLLVTLNLVAAYDWIISRLLKLFPRRQQQPVTPPIAIDFQRDPQRKAS
jgi:hypothetical protein